MDQRQRAFLDDLLTTASPSGYETAGQRVWVDYVSEFADEVRTDDYGNAVAVVEGGDPTVALAGHGDEIGFIVKRIEEEGFLRIGPIGGADRTVSKGQHVTVHADDPVDGVVGQTAIHLRDVGEEEYDDLEAQFVDIGVEDAETARELVDVGDPVTFSTTVAELQGTRVSARGMDNRVGIWAAAEGLRAAAESGVDATVCAVSTVQEEVGLQGAKMVGFDLDPDAAVAIDVTHATDSPGISSTKHGDVELGAGPTVTHGTSNHPQLVERVIEVADAEDIPLQHEPSSRRTGTDTDSIFKTRSGVPSVLLSVPLRYMHSTVEVADTEDIEHCVQLYAALVRSFGADEEFSVSL